MVHMIIRYLDPEGKPFKVNGSMSSEPARKPELLCWLPDLATNSRRGSGFRSDLKSGS